MLVLRFYAILLLVVAWPGLLHAETGGDSNNMLSFDKAVETLNQDFQQAPVWRQGGVQIAAPIKPLNDPSFSWAAGYIWTHPPVGVAPEWPPSGKKFPAWTSNGAADADPNGDMIAQIGESNAPLTWSDKLLSITARPMPADLAATVDKLDPKSYLSGSITSFPYAQLYGIFAISAKLPHGPGLWPAFWLLPTDKSWPPEIDVMEVIGRQSTTLYTTLHLKGPNGNLAHATDTHLDLSAEFHEYAVDWGPDRINWYFDRKLVFSQATPEDLRKPCYILANLGIGKPNDWGGAPDDTTKFPATMYIKSIRAWQRY